MSRRGQPEETGPDLMQRRNYLAAHRALHAAWTWHATGRRYRKELWEALRRALETLAIEGVGPLEDPPPAAGVTRVGRVAAIAAAARRRGGRLH